MGSRGGVALRKSLPVCASISLVDLTSQISLFLVLVAQNASKRTAAVISHRFVLLEKLRDCKLREGRKHTGLCIPST